MLIACGVDTRACVPKSLYVLVEHRYYLFTERHEKSATGTEVFLNVDDDERRVFSE